MVLFWYQGGMGKVMVASHGRLGSQYQEVLKVIATLEIVPVILIQRAT